jgi:hypothetical protein
MAVCKVLSIQILPLSVLILVHRFIIKLLNLDLSHWFSKVLVFNIIQKHILVIFHLVKHHVELLKSIIVHL